MRECRLIDYGEDGVLCETHGLAEAAGCTHAVAMVEKLQEALRNSTLLLKSLLGIEANCEGALDEQVRENKAALAASAGSGTEARLC